MELGDHSYKAQNVQVLQWKTNDTVKVGKYCSLAANVTFVLDGNHKYDRMSTYPFRELFKWEECQPNSWGKETPTVGNDVWIGMSATIYSGVHIGDGAIVAGQSVVTRSVPPYAIVAGNPARIKKYRFDEKTIEGLLKYKWWDLPVDVIREKLAPIMDDMPKLLDTLKEIRENE